MNRDWILAEWKRAARVLAEAESLLRGGFLEGAVSRAYYANLHGAKSALACLDIAAESHAAVRGLFGEHLVRKGPFEKEWAKVLGVSSEERMAADYDSLFFFASEDANLECRQARSFLERVRTYLVSRGIPTDDCRFEPPVP